MGARRLHPAERVAEYTEAGWWDGETTDSLLRERIRLHPGRLALVDPANKADLVDMPARRLSWAELDADVDRFAAVLLRHGLGQGDVVGVQLPNIAELVCVYLACWRIGVIVSPLPVQYREHETVQLGGLAGFTAFITAGRVGGREIAAEVDRLRDRLPQLRLLLAFGADVPAGAVPLDAELRLPYDPAGVAAYLREHPVDPNDCVTICWTSGTESTPKGVPRCHNDWLAIAWTCLEAPRMTEDDVLLNPFPMVNMAGFAGLFLPWLRAGCVLVQHHPFDLPVFLRQIAEERVTYTVAPPALLTMLLARDELLASTDISSLTRIGSGSAPLSPAMVRGWQERYGIGVINFFGSNEGTGMLTDPYDVPDPEQRARFFPRYGVHGVEWSTRGARWTKVRIVDAATGEDIEEPGRPGELRIKSPQVFAGYLGGTDLPSPFDDQGYLMTGDLFEIAGDRGQFLKYVDRAKDVVIRGGMNIAPAELEQLLAGHPAVAEVAVVGYPDELLGEKACAVVVARSALVLDDLVGYLKERHIASYKLPERLELRDELPRNPVGKVLKRVLRDSL
ncbi:class I adenylate-forming enzyme family protein [Streptomyces sp. H10-C2]|uniref:class I adenylate-forming enzyme family protein n=1 Tax=unclassified Streptomyces TaxID=2593676 RepID=UPI0024B8BF84|nr:MULTISPECIES: class I adenylate-forming enzyme family protein [unclassified Streptomyces]MDJ0343521.1 class I adenylate-forming enzyme family protein [Streptomyces sp. PH10-H1]MDJ0368903.1 class I adenylate-forming enzyme family protein [Streptomyces sp. H10-C2]